MKLKQVSGEDRGKVVLFALSTCGWCKKTKRLLNDLGVEYSYVDVDQVKEEAEKTEVVGELKKWNPKSSFPTLVIDDESCIVGFKEDEIKKAIKK
ncbi:MAG: glutaredoxin family protein [Candidatus Zixiibacteriota bacterium]|nr:MAG: glutaredoxin family protein [candidate division Zixibacteria bacterium]